MCPFLWYPCAASQWPLWPAPVDFPIASDASVRRDPADLDFDPVPLNVLDLADEVPEHELTRLALLPSR